MIKAYFAKIELAIQNFSYLDAYSLKKKLYNKTFGYIGGSITFTNGHRLDFMEVKQFDPTVRPKYRYHYMNENNEMIFRYDNSQHHKHLLNFPHHKHIPTEVVTSTEPELHDVLLEIARLIRESG